MKQTLILDSSQIDTYLTCPQLWRMSYKESLTKTDLSDKEAIAMGTLGHKWLEIYYHKKALNASTSLAVAAANRLNPDEMDNEPGDDHKFPLIEEKRQIVFKRLQEYWMTYSANDYVPDYKLKYKIGIDSNGMPVDQNEKVPLIEQGFSHKLLETSEYLFILEGRIDFIGTHNNQTFFMDHKLQLREHKLYSKSIQFKNYALATGLNLGIINYIRLHKETSAKTFVREPLAFGTYELKRWRSEVINTYVEIANAVKHDEYDYRWSSCSGKFGYACEFAEVCEEPNIYTANLIKIQNFKKKKEWRPW